MSSPAMIGGPELPDKDAAMSLCAMWHLIMQGNTNHNCPNPISWSPSDIDLQESNIVEDDQSRTSDCSANTVCQRRTKGKLPPKKCIAKRKESKREPRVSFEEMKRLMRVYGPTKCLRNRTPKKSGKSTKVLSIKRKFYRWFPDFHERFDLQTPGEWYKPKIGHEPEMKYREELRKKDQELLAAKRNSKKKGSQLEHVTKS